VGADTEVLGGAKKIGMKAYEYILSKQIQWALNKGISLIGSQGKRGRPAYTPDLDQNLFEPLAPVVRKHFESGDGGEINGNRNRPAKIQAVHSSSALGVNIFQYWQRIDQIPKIAAACGFCRRGNRISEKIVFEDKYPVDVSFRYPPNIDVVIHNSDSARYKRFAIECKFSEAYTSQGDHGLKKKYIDLKKVWDDIPNLYGLAKELCPEDNLCKYFHPAQLIKHILGLKKAFGKKGFRLLYLWYDVLVEEGSIHQKEIDKFIRIAKSDDIKFHSLSYQDLIARLSAEYRSDHDKFVKYITERYL